MKLYRKLTVCNDCLMAIANGDYTGMDEETALEVDAGMERLSKYGHLCPGDSDEDEDFSWRPCQCCQSGLGGSRHSAIILTDYLDLFPGEVTDES